MGIERKRSAASDEKGFLRCEPAFFGLMHRPAGNEAPHALILAKLVPVVKMSRLPIRRPIVIGRDEALHVFYAVDVNPLEPYVLPTQAAMPEQILQTGNGEETVQVWLNGAAATSRARLDTAALVADAYSLFLLGPMLLVRNAAPRRSITSGVAGQAQLKREERKLDCDVLQFDLRPGIGRSDEVLLDDARRYATRVEDIGGTAELHVWQDMVHVFPANLALLRAAKEALELIGGFLRAHLAEVTPPAH